MPQVDEEERPGELRTRTRILHQRILSSGHFSILDHTVLFPFMDCFRDTGYIEL
jgi:hypothetical protein